MLKSHKNLLEPRPSDRLRIGDGAIQRIGAGHQRSIGLRFRFAFQNVDRNQQNRRPGPAGSRGDDGHIDIVVDAPGMLHTAHPLGATRKQRDVIDLRCGIPIENAPTDFLHQGNNRHRRFQRFRQARHQQRCRGPVHRSDKTEAPGNARITVGHHRAGRLGAIARLVDAETRRHEVKRGR